MQLGIGRHRREPRVPDRVKHVEIVGRVLGRDGDAVAGLQAAAAPQRAGEPGGAAGELAIASQHARSEPDGRRSG